MFLANNVNVVRLAILGHYKIQDFNDSYSPFSSLTLPLSPLPPPPLSVSLCLSLSLSLSLTLFFLSFELMLRLFELTRPSSFGFFGAVISIFQDVDLKLRLDMLS